MGLPGYYLAREINRLQTDSVRKVSVLDIGSGFGRPWAVASVYLKTNEIQLSAIDSNSVDLEDHGFAQCNSPYPLEFIHGNLLEELAKIPDDSFHLVIALDVIEHLSKEDGYRMLYEMNRISTNGFGVSCPVGFLWQPPALDNPGQAHISGWSAAEFRRMGFSKIRTWHGTKLLTLPYYRKKYPLNYLTSPFYFLDVLVGKLIPRAASGLWAFCDKKLPIKPPTTPSYSDQFLL